MLQSPNESFSYKFNFRNNFQAEKFGLIVLRLISITKNNLIFDDKYLYNIYLYEHLFDHGNTRAPHYKLTYNEAYVGSLYLMTEDELSYLEGMTQGNNSIHEVLLNAR